MTDYAHPEALVDTQWVADHANDPKVRLIEVDVDFSNYQKGHGAGAVGFDWQKDLQAQPVRDMLGVLTDAMLRDVGAGRVGDQKTGRAGMPVAPATR